MASNYDNPTMQKKLEAPMPLIGMYIALASLACSLSMAADLVHGFRSNKLWFPSKYFSLNAASLTLLAVAMKLPADITTNMWSATDRLAKISSLALTSTAMAHFMPSLGSMSDKNILINITALAILIITVLADVCIQVVGTRSFLYHRVFFLEEILVLSLMMILLLVMGSTGIMVVTTKKCLEAKYQEKHKLGWNQGGGVVAVAKLRNLVNEYWVMAETSSPQFVISRSAASAASGAVSLANAVILAQAIVRIWVEYKSFTITSSSYGGSTTWILLVQSIGVIFGTISTFFRWCIAVRFRCSGSSLREVLKVEDYWTRKLVECQGSPISPKIKHHKCRRFLYNVRGFVVDFILKAQICVVLFNKLLLLISYFTTSSFTQFIKHLARRDQTPARRREVLQNERQNSLRLEGEADLPDYILQNISKQVGRVLQKARKQKSSGLIEFLRNSTFKGVAEFDSHEVPSIHGKEPKHCWSLAVVTLTSIAIALPNVPKTKVEQLVSDVRDGLFFVKIVEESFYKNEEWNNLRKAADYWLRVDLFRKWQHIDLAEISSMTNESKQALEILMEKSKIIASDLKTNIPDCPMFNPSNWPPKTIAANSMYRITATISNTDNTQTDEELFHRLSAMVADILAACLTNLARVIAKKCQIKAIEDRERSVVEAARLLGKSEEILEFLVKRDLPAGLNPNYGAAYIEEWRGAMFLEDEMGGSDATNSSNCSSPVITLLHLMHHDFEFSR